MPYRKRILVLFFLLGCVSCGGSEAPSTVPAARSATPAPATPTGTPSTRSQAITSSPQPTVTVETATPVPISLAPITGENAYLLEPLAQVQIPSEWGLTALEFDASGEKLAAANSDGLLVIWQFSDTGGSSIQADEPHVLEVNLGRWIDDLAFSPDESQIAVTGSGLGLRILNAVTAEEETSIPVGFRPSAIAYIGDGGEIAVAGHDFERIGPIAEVWNVDSMERIASLDGHPTTDLICSIALSSDETILAAGYCDYNMMTWDIANDYAPFRRVLGLYSWECFGHCGFPRNEIAFLPNSHILASGTDNEGIPLRNVDTGRLEIVISTARVTGENTYVWWRVEDIAFDPAGSILVITGRLEVQLRDTETGEFFHHIDIPYGEDVTHVTVSPSGTLLALGTSSGAIELWGIPR